MNLQSLQCTNCGASLDYVQGMPVLTCSHCGSRYQMQGSDHLTAVEGADGPLFHAWIPAGWGYAAEGDTRWISSQEIVTFNLKAANEQASLWFFPRAYFRDGNSKTYGLHPLTMQNTHQYLPLEQYVPQRLQETFPQARISQINFLNSEPFAALASQFLPEASRHIRSPEAESGMFQFELTIQNQTFYGFFGTILVHQAGQQQKQPHTKPQPRQQTQTQRPADMPPLPTEKQKTKMDFNFFMRGGLIGAKMRGEDIALPGGSELFQQGKEFMDSISSHTPSLSRSLWARGMDVVLLTTDPRLHLYQDIFTTFASNIHYGQGYLIAQQREAALVSQINMQGAMQRQQNQIAASRQLSNTLSQRSDMIMDTWNRKQAAQTRMSSNFSEAIRGVNSYTTTSGQTVEASVRYDHVYQNGSNFIASDANINIGPDWTELTRNK